MNLIDKVEISQKILDLEEQLQDVRKECKMLYRITDLLLEQCVRYNDQIKILRENL